MKSGEPFPGNNTQECSAASWLNNHLARSGLPLSAQMTCGGGEWKECILFRRHRTVASHFPLSLSGRAPGRAISPSSGLNPEAARPRPHLIPQEASREDVAAVCPEDTKGASRYMQLSQELTAFSCSK